MSEFERGRIIGMMECDLSAWRIVSQIGHSDLTVRRYWDQWIWQKSRIHHPGLGQSHHTIARCLSKEYLASQCSLSVLPKTTNCPQLFPFGMVLQLIKLNSDRMEPGWNQWGIKIDSMQVVMTIVYVCECHVVNSLILSLFYSSTLLQHLVWWCGVPKTLSHL